VAAIRWYHIIDLGNGIVTPGQEDCAAKLGMLGMPASLAGRTVLDIGAWDGFYSFEAERRGAARVVATDSFCWDGGGWGTRAGFDLAREVLQSRVEDRWMNVSDLSPDHPGVFDLVLFLGVLYHLEDQLPALRRVASVTGEQLILETVCDWIGTPQPAVAFYPGSELGGDPTNWWGANPAAVEAMLRVAGFRKVVLHYLQPLPLRLGIAVSAAWRKKQSFRSRLRQGRAVFHAWK